MAPPPSTASQRSQFSPRPGLLQRPGSRLLTVDGGHAHFLSAHVWPPDPCRTAQVDAHQPRPPSDAGCVHRPERAADLHRAAHEPAHSHPTAGRGTPPLNRGCPEFSWDLPEFSGGCPNYAQTGPVQAAASPYPPDTTT